MYNHKTILQLNSNCYKCSSWEWTDDTKIWNAGCIRQRVGGGVGEQTSIPKISSVCVGGGGWNVHLQNKHWVGVGGKRPYKNKVCVWGGGGGWSGGEANVHVVSFSTGGRGGGANVHLYFFSFVRGGGGGCPGGANVQRLSITCKD